MYETVLYESTVNMCEFCNEAEGTSEIASRPGDLPEPEISVLACERCLARLEQGEKLVDIYAWSWAKRGDQFRAEYIKITEEEFNGV